jgi:hypothetical protein
MSDITERSLELFLDYARDADNWSGTPLIGGNVGGYVEDRGNLTQLERAGLLKTFEYDGETWIDFTAAGVALAAEHGASLKTPAERMTFSAPGHDDTYSHRLSDQAVISEEEITGSPSTSRALPYDERSLDMTV